MSDGLERAEVVVHGEIVEACWEENEAGLPVFRANSPDLAVQEYVERMSAEGVNRIHLGGIAATVSDKRMYGEGSLATFARECKTEYSRMKQHMLVYKRLSRLEIVNQLTILKALGNGMLTHTHLLAAAAIEADWRMLAVLSRAHDGPPPRLCPVDDATGERIRRDRLTVSETRRHVRRIKDHVRKMEQRAIGEANPIPPDTARSYRTLVVDPPWEMQDIERDVRPNQYGFDYPTMNAGELLEFGGRIGELAADDCHLYLWTTHKHLPLALDLANEWGFRYECLMTWVKNVGFTPYSWMRSTEHVIFARRGGLDLLRLGKRLDFNAKVREHSRKPDEFYELVREVSPGPRIDVFSREARAGFDGWGNESGKFTRGLEAHA